MCFLPLTALYCPTLAAFSASVLRRMLVSPLLLVTTVGQRQRGGEGAPFKVKAGKEARFIRIKTTVLLLFNSAFYIEVNLTIQQVGELW